MTNLSKRIYTSLILLIIFTISIYNNLIFFLFIILCSYQIFYEFFYLLEKILKHKNKIYLYIFLFFILIFLTYLSCFILFNFNSNDELDKIFLFLLITISISTDIGGFIFGNIFKGRKLTKISPKKTYSGMFGSYVTTLIIVYFFFKNYFDTQNLLIIAFFVSTISQLGDLSISYLKRKANLKDTGTILPGHGGILDRFDGLIFVLTIGSMSKIILW